MKCSLLRNIMMVAVLVGAAAVADAQQITLDDITNYRYYPKQMKDVVPLADGESYSCVTDDGQRIERCSFKTGELIETLFDASTDCVCWHQ